MASPDLALLAIMIFSIIKLVGFYNKTRNKQDSEVIPMNENKTNTAKIKKFLSSTFYNAMCGVLGNVITELGAEMHPLKNHQ